MSGRSEFRNRSGFVRSDLLSPVQWGLKQGLRGSLCTAIQLKVWNVASQASPIDFPLFPPHTPPPQ
jgi:hypothetical protein